MTEKDIKDRILSGDSLIVIFGINKDVYMIGDSVITRKQYDKALSKFRMKMNLEIKMEGLTKHIYTLKK